MKAYIVKNKQGEYLICIDQGVRFETNTVPWLIELFETEDQAKEFMNFSFPEMNFDIFEVVIP